MSDNQQAYKPLDPGRIDVLNSVELQYWSRELQCGEEELKQAIAEVGDHAAAVRDHLASGR